MNLLTKRCRRKSDRRVLRHQNGAVGNHALRVAVRQNHRVGYYGSDLPNGSFMTLCRVQFEYDLTAICNLERSTNELFSVVMLERFASIRCRNKNEVPERKIVIAIRLDVVKVRQARNDYFLRSYAFCDKDVSIAR